MSSRAENRRIVWNSFNTAEIQHLYVALLSSPMSHELTRALRAEVAGVLDERGDVAWSVKPDLMAKAELALADAERLILAYGATAWIGSLVLEEIRTAREADRAS